MVMKSGRTSNGYFELEDDITYSGDHHHRVSALSASSSNSLLDGVGPSSSSKLFRIVFGRHGVGSIGRPAIDKLRLKIRHILEIRDKELDEEERTTASTVSSNLSSSKGQGQVSPSSGSQSIPNPVPRRTSRAVSFKITSEGEQEVEEVEDDFDVDRVSQFESKPSSHRKSRWSLSTTLALQALEEEGVDTLAALASTMRRDIDAIDAVEATLQEIRSSDGDYQNDHNSDDETESH